LFERYLRPEPRLRVGTLLARNRVASACIDLSDGLADGLHLVGAASSVGVRIESAAVPVEDAARQWFVSRGEDPVMSALAGGDDYELLFAVRPRMRRRLEAVVRHVDVQITRVGVCTSEPGATIVGRDAGVPRELPVPPGYRHFR
jgi:thiamine-monophosphate kinase